MAIVTVGSGGSMYGPSGGVMPSVGFTGWNYGRTVDIDTEAAPFIQLNQTNTSGYYSSYTTYTLRGTGLSITPDNTDGSGPVIGARQVTGTVNTIALVSGTTVSHGTVSANYRIEGLDVSFAALVANGADPLAFLLSGNDTITGSGMYDRLLGYGGDDVFLPGYSGPYPSSLYFDTVDGGSGNDTVSYANLIQSVFINLATGIVSIGSADAPNSARLTSIENAIGSSGNDVITGNNAANYLEGGSGNDTILGLGGNDILLGGTGNDTLNGGAGNDSLLGGEGNDFLVGGIGNDALDGENGNDSLIGNAGNDLMFGSAGNDFLTGGAGADTLNGGIGIDRAQYSDATAGVRADLAQASNNLGDAAGDIYVSIENLYGSNHNDWLSGNSGHNSLWGGNGDDFIYGGAGNDRIFGDAGNDQLLDEAGNDFVSGGLGNDTIVMGAGTDTFSGGAGDDTYIFTNYANGHEIITDFTWGNDRINFTLTDMTHDVLMNNAVETSNGVLLNLGSGSILLAGLAWSDVDWTNDFVFY